MPFYIQCDNYPTQTNNGEWNRCPSTESVILTESELQNLTSSQELPTDVAWAYSIAMFTCCFFAWGIKLALKQYNIGV